MSKTNVRRSLTTLILALAAAAPASEASTSAGEYYGTAPESLDYPAESTSSRSLQLERMREEELATQTDENPFPTDAIPSVDPLSKKKVDRVLVGPVFRARGYGMNFDYYRYVTFYDIQYRKERIYALPVLHEDCHDQSEVFGSYSYTHSYSASVSASIGVESLGLSGSITDTRTFSTSRNLRATGNLIADHTPYFAKQDWYGRTFVQTYTNKTGTAAFIMKESKGSPLWIKIFFPVLAESKYPFDFAIRDADWSFVVERTIVSKCSTTDADEGGSPQSLIVRNTNGKATTERSLDQPVPSQAHAVTSDHHH